MAAQRETTHGGLRDKPGKRPDLYHTCNNLAGLSIAQHHMVHSPSRVEANRARFDTTKGFPPIKPTKPEGGWKSEEERQAVRKEAWSNILGWEQSGEDVIVGSKENRVVSETHVHVDSEGNHGTSCEHPFTTSCTICRLLLRSNLVLGAGVVLSCLQVRLLCISSYLTPCPQDSMFDPCAYPLVQALCQREVFNFTLENLGHVWCART